MRLLIIGAHSAIGQAAMGFFEKAGYDCTGTVRPGRMKKGKLLPLDLETVETSWQAPAGFDAAIFCAAVTNIHECEKNPKRSHQINVVGTIRVLESLLKSGVFPIFLSSNQIFDGLLPLVNEDAAPRPQVLYGAQKAEVETWLKNQSKPFAILRPSKILEGEKTVLFPWYTELLAGKTITPFSDLALAPVTVGTLLPALEKIVSRKKAGIFHISGDEEISYAEAGAALAQAMGLPASRVKPAPAKELGFHGFLPRHVSMGMSRMKDLGIQQPSSRLELDNYLHTLLGRTS